MVPHDLKKMKEPTDSKDRLVKASPALLEALREHIGAMDLEGQVKRWDPEQRRLAFPTPTGRIIRHGHFIEQVWQPLVSKAGVPYRKYHATRHSYATWLLEDGTDLRWVQAQMGHVSIEQTYGHCQPERHESAVVGLDRYLPPSAPAVNSIRTTKCNPTATFED